MKIAILGTRGIPANYGGFETFAEHLSQKLVERGHQVTVYGRKPFFKQQNNIAKAANVIDNAGSVRIGSSIIQTISTPTIFHKYLETPLHSLTSFLDVLLYRRFDAIILCNAANSPFSFLARLKGIPVYTNVDGVERKRKKWNVAGRLWYLLGELSAVLFSNKIIADAECIAQYYKCMYRIDAAVIAYGAEEVHIEAGGVLKKFGLTAGHYLLYVSRLEPENNALGVIEAYKRSGIADDATLAVPLVIVGDAPYAAEYKARLQAAAEGSPKIIFTGFQFGDTYRELRSNCLAYVQATEVGGTHPALVEALAHGNLVIANDVPEHREVLADCGLYYGFNDFVELGERMRDVVVGDAQGYGKYIGYKEAAKLRAKEVYGWDKIAEAYEKVLRC